MIDLIDDIVIESEINIELDTIEYLIKECCMIQNGYHIIQEGAAVAQPNQQENSGFIDKVKNTIASIFNSALKFLGNKQSIVREKQNEKAMEEIIREELGDQVPPKNISMDELQQKWIDNANDSRRRELRINVKWYINNINYDNEPDFHWPDQKERIEKMLFEFTDTQKILTTFTEQYIVSLGEIQKDCNNITRDLGYVDKKIENSFVGSDETMTDRMDSRTRLRTNKAFMLEKMAKQINQSKRNLEKVEELFYSEYRQNSEKIANLTDAVAPVLENMRKYILTFIQELENKKEIATQYPTEADKNVGTLNPNDKYNPISITKMCLQVTKETIDAVLKYDKLNMADTWAFKKYHSFVQGLVRGTLQPRQMVHGTSTPVKSGIQDLQNKWANNAAMSRAQSQPFTPSNHNKIR